MAHTSPPHPGVYSCQQPPSSRSLVRVSSSLFETVLEPLVSRLHFMLGINAMPLDFLLIMKSGNKLKANVVTLFFLQIIHYYHSQILSFVFFSDQKNIKYYIDSSISITLYT